MIDISRHKELFDPRKFDMPINVLGVGATGSWLALILAKLGIPGKQITVYDFDVIEEHNISNQAYGLPNVGFPKVTALQGDIERDTGTFINAKNTKYTNQPLYGFVFNLVDSMAERQRIWNESIKMKPRIYHYVEPRLGLSLGRIYNVKPFESNHITKYENTFYGDEEAEMSACGNSMTVVTSAITVAAWCARQLINFSNNVELDNEILIDLENNHIVAEKW